MVSCGTSARGRDEDDDRKYRKVLTEVILGFLKSCWKLPRGFRGPLQQKNSFGTAPKVWYTQLFLMMLGGRTFGGQAGLPAKRQLARLLFIHYSNNLKTLYFFMFLRETVHRFSRRSSQPDPSLEVV